jgi:hypothetical protein
VLLCLGEKVLFSAFLEENHVGKGSPLSKEGCLPALLEYFNEFPPLGAAGGKVQNANSATKKCKWCVCLPSTAHSGKAPAQGAALKVMDGAGTPSPASFRLPTASWRTWGDQILTIASEHFLVILLQA